MSRIGNAEENPRQGVTGSIDNALADAAATALSLLKKYKDQRMDLADACIVRMTELMRDCRVVTSDRSDFSVYRRNSREAIPLIAPPGRS